MEHRQNSDMSSSLSAHNARNERNTFLPRVPVNWETHLNWMHRSVNHLRIHKPLVLHLHSSSSGRSPPTTTLWGKLRFSKGGEVLEAMSRHRQGLMPLTKCSEAEQGLAKSLVLDHPANQLQRNQQMMQLCLQIGIKWPPNTPTKRWLIWSITDIREEEAKIIACIAPFSFCLSPTVTIHHLEYSW